MDLGLPNLPSQWPHPTCKQHGPFFLHDGQYCLPLLAIESFRKPLFAIHFNTTMQWVNHRNVYPFWECVKLKKPCISWHWVDYTNPFHVTYSITYNYGFIVVVCPRKGGGKGP
jgi:hypothetical protein